MGYRLLASLALVPLALPLTAMATPGMGVAMSMQRPEMSTGVTPARLVYNDGINLPTYIVLGQMSQRSRTVRLTVEVNKPGPPRDVQVTSPDSLLDTPVLKAVNKFWFRPAQLDHHSIASRVNLVVKVHS